MHAVISLVIHISSVLAVHGSPIQGEEKASQYLQKYGYLNTKDLSEGLKSFQKSSGLAVTGTLDADTLHYMQLARCGAKDTTEEHRTKEVLRYSVTKYPDSSLLSGDNIDNAVLTAANLWQTERVKIVKNTDGAVQNDIEIVFCDFSECIAGYSVESDGEEIARPVTRDGMMTLYLDSEQSWADESTLSTLGYGGAMNRQVQLLQVVLHQFGHTLGLAHSARGSSAMVPFYMEWVAGVGPDKEDLEMVKGTGVSRAGSGNCGIVVLAAALILFTFNIA